MNKLCVYFFLSKSFDIAGKIQFMVKEKMVLT